MRRTVRTATNRRYRTVCGKMMHVLARVVVLVWTRPRSRTRIWQLNNKLINTQIILYLSPSRKRLNCSPRRHASVGPTSPFTIGSSNMHPTYRSTLSAEKLPSEVIYTFNICFIFWQMCWRNVCRQPLVVAVVVGVVFAGRPLIIYINIMSMFY
jgi:hypothetical protein